MWLVLSLLLAGCAGSPPARDWAATLAPLQLPERQLTLAEVPVLAPSPDLLAVDDSMRAFVREYTAGVQGDRQRLLNLHRAVSGPATLGIEYDPAAEGGARDTFHREAANCLSYANLFVALAREADLDARYNWVEVRPQWTRLGEWVAVRLHVNATVVLGPRDRYLVDIDPLPSRDITGSREISDRDALALYHSNIAMDALSRDALEVAWAHAVRALQLAPSMSHLWVNLGVVYRRAEQYRVAEQSYQRALALDSLDRSAMNNLMVLYQQEGRAEEAAFWAGKIDAYRDRNPYYHAWLGDMAGQEADWRGALGHYLEALALAPDDPNLHYATGVIYAELAEPLAARRYLEQAVARATLQRDLAIYRARLDALLEAQTAGSY